MLTCAIHQEKDKVAVPDVAYTAGHLRVFGDLYDDKHLAEQPEVKALLKYTKERK
jgi:hypothetical protein